MNKETIRVLILEDNPADADLVQFELEEAGIAFTAKVVTTEKDFIRELQKFSPDIILSDYDLHKYTGALALAEAKKRCPDVPFILVTGAVSEDRAIEILTSGAKDYVMKNRLNRLAPAVRRALKEAEEHRARKAAEKELRQSHKKLELLIEERTVSLQKELTERKNAEWAVRESEERFKAIASNTPDHILVQDRELRYSFVINPQMGLTQADMIGKTDYDFLAKDNADKLTAIKQRVLATGKPEHLEFPLVDAKGGVHYFEGSYLPMFDGKNQVTGIIGYFRNVTKRKQVEEISQKALQRLQTMVSSMQGAILLVGEDRVELVNQTFCDYFTLRESPADLTGLTSREIIEKIKNAYLHPEEETNRIKEIIRRGQPVTSEEVAMQEGRSCLRDFIPIIVEGKSYGRLWYHMDITERKQIAETQKFLATCNNAVSSKSFFESLALHLGEVLKADYVCIDRLEGDCLAAQTVAVYYDGKFEDNVAYTLKDTPCGDVVGKSICVFPTGVRHLFPKDDVLQEMMAESYIGATLWSTQGQPIGLIALLWRSPMANQEIVESVLKLVSIRAAGELERMTAEEELNKHATRLAALNKELESFSYSVSHDLRAPLRAIDGYSKMILKKQGDKFDEETRRQFEQIRSSTKDMGQLIDDLLTLSRLGRQEVKIKDIDMRQLIEEVWRELQSADPDRRVTLKMKDIPRGWGDRALLKQVLVNLFSNALKFSRTRTKALIEVGGNEGENGIDYYIKDNGVGFDMMYHDKMFGVFQRLHSASEYEGTGIGLAIVQRIIHHHGGKVWAESKMDKGAVFNFTLPGKA